jgi:hypothetical protein
MLSHLRTSRGFQTDGVDWLLAGLLCALGACAESAREPAAGPDPGGHPPAIEREAAQVSPAQLDSGLQTGAEGSLGAAVAPAGSGSQMNIPIALDGAPPAVAVSSPDSAAAPDAYPMSDAADTKMPDAAGTAPLAHCPGSMLDVGSEGQHCVVVHFCDNGERYGVRCTRVNGHDFGCECVNNGTRFAVRGDPTCEAMIDADFINARCEARLEAADGQLPDLVVTATTQEPAFVTPPFSAASCGAPTIVEDGAYSCSFRVACGRELQVDCADPMVASASCRCLVDGKYYRGISSGRLVCPSLNAASAIALCGLDGSADAGS